MGHRLEGDGGSKGHDQHGCWAWPLPVADPRQGAGGSPKASPRSGPERSGAREHPTREAGDAQRTATAVDSELEAFEARMGRGLGGLPLLEVSRAATREHRPYGNAET